MPATALLYDEPINAFDYSHERFAEEIKSVHKRDPSALRFAWGARAIPRSGTLVTPHFSHPAGAVRPDGWQETPAHRAGKDMISRAAFELGWEAALEVPIATSDGVLISDCLVTRPDGFRFGVEIQWSGQSDEERALRTERYRQSGLEVIWLQRKRVGYGLGAPDALPLSQIKKGDQDVRYGDLGLTCFSVPLERAAAGILRCSSLLLLPTGAVELESYEPTVEQPLLVQDACYRCDRDYWDLICGEERMWAGGVNLDTHRQLATRIEQAHRLRIAPLAVSYSATAGTEYPMRRCPHCKAKIGDYYRRSSPYEDDVVVIGGQLRRLASRARFHRAVRDLLTDGTIPAGFYG